MTTWVWRSPDGTHARTADADRVDFMPGHVIFYIDRTLILAVRNEDAIDLHPEPEGDPAWWT